MKKYLVLLVVLAMAGIASGSAIIPSTHDIESLTPGLTVHGQGGFVFGYTYGTTSGDVVSGGPAGTQAIGAGTGGTMGGAAMQIIGGTGLVDITLDLGSKGGANGIRKEVLLVGDGTWGAQTALVSMTNFFQTTVYQGAYKTCYWSVRGNGLDTANDPLGAIPPANWTQIHLRADIAANTLLVEIWDIDDSLGTIIGTAPVCTVYNGASPFATSLDAIEFGGDWAWVPGGYGMATFDNLVITPEPVTLGLLALGAGMFLVRRRR